MFCLEMVAFDSVADFRNWLYVIWWDVAWWHFAQCRILLQCQYARRRSYGFIALLHDVVSQPDVNQTAADNLISLGSSQSIHVVIQPRAREWGRCEAGVLCRLTLIISRYTAESRDQRLRRWFAARLLTYVPRWLAAASNGINKSNVRNADKENSLRFYVQCLQLFCCKVRRMNGMIRGNVCRL